MLRPTVRSGDAAASREHARPGMPIGPQHPMCRGDIPALVFSGKTLDFGELPGEPTAHALYKFALPDPRLEPQEDFAHSAGAAMRRWPADRVQAIDGVCFVFQDAAHPLAQHLLQNQARIDQHLVILEGAAHIDADHDRIEKLGGFINSINSPRRIVVLGFGQQGQRIVAYLQKQHRVPLDQLVVWEANAGSRHAAEYAGFSVTDDAQVVQQASAVIYSPLMRHSRLYSLLEQAQAAGLPTFDNSMSSSGSPHFVERGPVFLDHVADNGVQVKGQVLRSNPHELDLSCQVVRSVQRRIGGASFPHLFFAGSATLTSKTAIVDLSSITQYDGLSSATLKADQAFFVSLRARADLGFFAARHLSERLWSNATREVFPSTNVHDLGATSFERLLQNHMVGREVASTMQTPAQRALLGVAAFHFAAQRPIIEIGSAFGGSALLMASATERHKPRVYSIDPEASTRDVMRFAFEREGHADRLVQIVKPSDEARSDVEDLRGGAGLVFIDGLHTVGGVQSDYEQYADLVAPGGALLFHDVCPAIHSVMRVVFDRVLNDPRFEIRCLVDGLAVFERR